MGRTSPDITENVLIFKITDLTFNDTYNKLNKKTNKQKNELGSVVTVDRLLFPPILLNTNDRSEEEERRIRKKIRV